MEKRMKIGSTAFLIAIIIMCLLAIGIDVSASSQRCDRCGNTYVVEYLRTTRKYSSTHCHLHAHCTIDKDQKIYGYKCGACGNILSGGYGEIGSPYHNTKSCNFAKDISQTLTSYRDCTQHKNCKIAVTYIDQYYKCSCGKVNKTTRVIKTKHYPVYTDVMKKIRAVE